MSIRDLYTRHVETIATTASIRSAAHRMYARNVGTLVIRDRAGVPTGILTDRDVALRVIGMDKDPSKTSVEEAMTKHPVAVPQDATLRMAMAAMRDAPCRRLLVVDPGGQLVGLLSLDDVLSVIGEEFTDIAELLAHEKPVCGAQF